MAENASSIPGFRQQSTLRPGRTERRVSLVVLAAVAAALWAGWQDRGADWINPERGIGYALGIVGGSLMIVLLAYPLRKRLGSRRAPGSVGFWFRVHMVLGLAGPLAILFHARFGWGALNSAVALGSMLVVAGSGLVGRYLYSRVHRGFSDRKLEVAGLKREMEARLNELEGYDRTLIPRLKPLEDRALAAASGFWTSAAAVVTTGYATRRARREIARLVAGHAAALHAADDWFEAVRRTAEFAFYDRLLRLWHLLHMPLFLIMVAAAVLHIVAVHMY